VIDFRYHLVSIVAVLLALAIGIVLGSGFIGGPVLDQLKNRLDSIENRNSKLIEEGVERNRELDGYRDFSDAVQPELVRGALIGRQVMVITVEGTDGSTVDALRDVIEEAGGTVASTTTLLASFALEDAQDRSELGSIVGSQRSSPDALRRDVANLLATRIGAAASVASQRPRVGPTSDERLERMLNELADAGFLDIDRLEEDVTAPGGAVVLLVVGGGEQPAFDPRPMIETLGIGLSQRGALVLAASPAASTWGITESICDDPGAADAISTVDHADTIYGQTAVALGLGNLPSDDAGHYGLDACATGVIPDTASAG
jgi:hypothetical protein